MGDLTPNRLGSYRTLKPAINLFASGIFSPSWSVRANLGIGKLKGDDSKYALPEYRQQRNFLFTASPNRAQCTRRMGVLGGMISAADGLLIYSVDWDMVSAYPP